MQNSQICANVLISGLVQGVGYRFSTRQQARKLNLKGWVRNLADSRVEAVFEGEPSAVEQMIKWCHQGPPGAIVEEVQTDFTQPQGLKGFEIVY
jgi:acylphosphatase